MPVDIDGVCTFVDFEVIEIIGDSRPYPALLSIDWAIGSKAVIDLKRRQMTFEDAQIRVIAPLDPYQGPRYIEPIRAEEEAHNIDSLYQMTANQNDYINPTAEGNISWRCDSSCASDSDVGLENWQNRLYEVLARRCTYLTKSLRWIRAELKDISSFDGLVDVNDFLYQFEQQGPHEQRTVAMDLVV